MLCPTRSDSHHPVILDNPRSAWRVDGWPLCPRAWPWATLLLAAVLVVFFAPIAGRAQEPAAAPIAAPASAAVGAVAQATTSTLVAAPAPRAERRPWQPAPAPANAPVLSQVCRIVNYADDMARTDSVGYPQTRWRYADIPYATAAPRKPEPWPFVIAQDADVNGNGRTDDDYVAALEFSMADPLSTPEWPASPMLPERQNARFYGGEVWRVANAKPGAQPFFAEIGINPDHQGPFFDDRADDHPIQGEADSRPDSVHQHTVAILWKKEDFLNGGDRSPVTFNDSSRLAVLVARYWYAFDDVRFIVQDGKDLYICEQGQDIPAKTFDWTTGRVFSIAPTKTRWAKYDPKGHEIAFNVAKANFEEHSFDDVQAVGWYLAKNNLGKSFSHTKWYTFEAVAVVNRPERPSEHLAMAPVPGSRPGGGEVPDFFLGACEVPYSLWKQVFRYGNSPTYTWAPTYVFDKDGDMGSMQLGNVAHEQDEPVTNLTLHDAAAFCNALSEMEGRTPCYYSDAEHKQVFRYEQLATRARLPGKDMADLNTKNPVYEIEPPPKVFVRWDADGYRLPTPAEWESALRIGKAQVDPAQAWVAANGEAKTHAVGTLQADALKLRDMLGNVWEMTWDFGDVLDPAKQDTLLALGGAIGYPADPATLSASPYGDVPYGGHATIGLRIVRRKEGLGAPAIGRLGAGAVAAGDVGYSVNDGMPEWRVRRGEKTKGAAEAKPAAKPAEKPLLAMAQIPAGTYKRQPDGSVVSIAAMEAAKTPATYAQWNEVRQWALARGYSFSHDGAMGSMYWLDYTHTPDEPVTGIAWHDVVVWCNALSEMEGRTPVYYDNEATTQVLRTAFKCRPIKIPGPELVAEKHPFDDCLRAERMEPWIFERWDVDGYRLPTSAEWDYLARGGSVEKYFWGATDQDKDACEWDVENAGGTSHPVGQKKPNGFGLFDIVGNVYTWLSGPSGASVLSREFSDDTNNPKASRYWAYHTPEFKYQRCTPPLVAGGSWFWGTAPFEGDRGGPKYSSPATAAMPDIGLRVVRCKAGTHPRDGNQPIPETVLLKFDPKTFDPLAGAAWRGGLLRDGVFDVAGVVAAPNKPRWRYDRTDASASSPVVAGGMLFIGAADRFIALDASTGVEKWAVPVQGGVDASACVAGGMVYFGGNDGRVHAVDAVTGAEKWAVLVEGNAERAIASSPAVAYGVVFVNAEGPAGLDAATGALAWRAKKHSAPAGLGSPTIFGPLLIQSGAGLTSVDFCDIRLGKSKETAIQGYNCLSTSAVSNGVVYVVNSGTGGFNYAGLTAVDIATRQKKWGIVIEEHLSPEKRTPVVASPTVWGGRVYVGSDGGRLYAFAAADGKPLWSLSLKGAIQSCAAVAAKSGLLYIGAKDGNLYCLDAKTGIEKWHFKTGGEVTASPCLGDGVVYLASQDGWVYALE